MKLRTAIFVVPIMFTAAIQHETRLAAASPRTSSDYLLSGLSEIVAHRYTEAATDFFAAANEGNADAAFNLGIMYYDGQGVPVSDTESTKWMLKAAAEGNVRAAYNSVSAYESGTGVAVNYTQANFWSDKVTARGYKDNYNLAEMYDAGDDTAGSYTSSVDTARSAIAWTTIAAQAGDPVSEAALAGDYGYGGSFPEDDEKSFFRTNKAAKQGYEESQFNLGSDYYNGTGVKKNIVEAYTWYDLAAIKGDDVAHENCESLKKEMSVSQLKRAMKMVDTFEPSP